MKARYNRVSTANQSLERQLAKQNPDEVLYNDIVSGSVVFRERARGKELLDDIEAGKVNYLSVSSIDRLGRNLMDILGTLELCNDYGATIKVDNLGLESMVDGKVNQVFKLIISVLGNVAEMERENILERQREGIAIAKAKGVYKGRERGSVESDAVVLRKYKEVVKLLNESMSIRRTAKLADVSNATVQKVKRILDKNLTNVKV